MVWEGEKKYGYTSDTAWFEQLPHIISQVSLVICEASLQEKDRNYAKASHLTAAEAGKLAFQSKASRLMLTHFFPEYDLNVIKREAEEGFHGRVIMAQEGLKIR